MFSLCVCEGVSERVCVRVCVSVLRYRLYAVFLHCAAERWYLFLEPAFALGRGSGNPPRTRSEAACQRLDALASRALSDPRRTKEQTEQRVLPRIRLYVQGFLGNGKSCGVRDISWSHRDICGGVASGLLLVSADLLKISENTKYT